MNKPRFFIDLLIFAAGGTAGGLITYFAVRDRFAKIADKEIESMRNWARERVVAKDKERKEELAHALSDSTQVSSMDSPDILYNTLKSYATQIADITGGEIDILEDIDEYFLEADDEEEISRVNPPDDLTGIEQLNEEDYIISDSYDKVMITYDEATNDFYDEDDTPIIDIQSLIGEYAKLVKKIRVPIFVRNHDLGNDYEVFYSRAYI